MTGKLSIVITTLLLVFVASKRSSGSPIEQLLSDFLDDASDSQPDFGDDYELHFDQRQNGTENYRLNVDGVLIAVPAASQSSIGSLGLLASSYLMDFADATGNGDDEDDDDDNLTENEANDKPYRFELNDPNISGKRGEKRPSDEHSNEMAGVEHILGVHSDGSGEMATVAVMPKKEVIAIVEEIKPPVAVVEVVRPTAAADTVRTVEAATIEEQQTRQKATGPHKKRNK